MEIILGYPGGFSVITQVLKSREPFPDEVRRYNYEKKGQKDATFTVLKTEGDYEPKNLGSRRWKMQGNSFSPGTP